MLPSEYSNRELLRKYVMFEQGLAAPHGESQRSNKGQKEPRGKRLFSDIREAKSS